MELTPSELIILGLVIERPAHGYDLEKTIEQRGIRLWTEIGSSSIYYLLAKLEKRRLIDGRMAASGARERRVFQATGEGRAVAARAATAYLAEPAPIEQPFLVGLASLPLLSNREYTDALRARLARLEASIAGLTQSRESQEPVPHVAREIFTYSLRLMEAERSWLAERVQAADD